MSGIVDSLLPGNLTDTAPSQRAVVSYSVAAANAAAARTLAYNDFIANWWDGTNNHIRNTQGDGRHDNGLPTGGDVITWWQMAQGLSVLYDEAMQGNSDAATKVGLQWVYLKAKSTPASLKGNGSDDASIGYTDDFAWKARLFRQIHEVTGDPLAIQYLAEMIAAGTKRFHDPLQQTQINYGTTPGGLPFKSDPYGYLYVEASRYEDIATFGYCSTAFQAIVAEAALYLYRQNNSTYAMYRTFAEDTYNLIYNNLRRATPANDSKSAAGLYLVAFNLDPNVAAATSSFTGYISGTTLRVTSGSVSALQFIAGGVKDSAGHTLQYGTRIVSGSGSTWTVNISQTFGSSSAPAAMTSSLAIRGAGDPNEVYHAGAFAYFGKPIRGLTAEAISVTMAMGVLAAEFYVLTNTSSYLAEAQSTAVGLPMTNGFGRIVDGVTQLGMLRDPWTDGTLFPTYARVVLPLAGVDPANSLRAAILNTAAALNAARNADGYYGPDWAGPEYNFLTGRSTWIEDSIAGFGGFPGQGGQATPAQIMTTSTGIGPIQAAAIIAAAGVSYSSGTPTPTLSDLASEVAAVKTAVAAKADLGGHQFFGGIFGRDPQYYFDLDSDNASINWDNQDFTRYTRSSNTLTHYVGGSPALTVTASGLNVATSAYSGQLYLGSLYGYAGINFAGGYGVNGGGGATRIYSNNSVGLQVAPTGINIAPGSYGGQFYLDSVFGYPGMSFTAGHCINGGGGAVRLYVNNSVGLQVAPSGINIGPATFGGQFYLDSIFGNPGLSFAAGQFINGGGGALRLCVNNAEILRVTGSDVFTFGTLRAGADILPQSDNQRNVGSSSLRFANIYAASGVINTSDEREKTSRGSLSAAELAAAKQIAAAIAVYQWNESIVQKGADGARLHVGVIAQRVVAILEECGLEPARYAFVCHDRWEASEGSDASSSADSSNELPAPTLRAVAAGERYGLRYDELAMFIMAAQEQRLRALEAK